MEFLMKKHLFFALLLGLTAAVGCGGGGDGAGPSGGDSNGDGTDAEGTSHDGPWCASDGTVQPLFSDAEFAELSQRLGLTEGEQETLQHQLDTWHSGMEAACNIEDPVERQDAIDRWNESFVASSAVVNGEVQAEVEAAIQAREAEG